MRQRATIDVLEFAAQRHAVRDSRCLHIMPGRHVREVMGSGIALYSRIRCNNHFIDRFVAQPLFERGKAQLLGPDAVERRQVPHQYEVHTAKPRRVLDRHDIGRRFDDAELRLVTTGCGADRTQLVLGEHAAAAAMADALHCVGQRTSHVVCAFPVPLQEMERNPLGRLLPYPGHAAQ